MKAAEQQQTPLKPIVMKNSSSQQSKPLRLRGVQQPNESKRIKTEASELNITSDQIMLQREEYGDKVTFKGVKRHNKDDLNSSELETSILGNSNIENMQRVPTEENNRILKKIQTNQQQQQQYLEFWQQQSKKGKYIDSLPMINNQNNQMLPSVNPLKTPSSTAIGNTSQFLSNAKMRNLSAASKDPVKTPQIRQIQASTTSKSNKKNNFYLKDDPTILSPLENGTVYAQQQQQLGGDGMNNNNNLEDINTRSHSPNNMTNGKTILRSYTIERGNALSEESQLDKSILGVDDNRRNSQNVQRVLNRSQTRTPSKNQQPIALQQLSPNGASAASGIQSKMKYNQNHLQQMRNLQNSQLQMQQQLQQHNHDMYNFYYNQESQSNHNPLNSKRNSQKTNLQSTTPQNNNNILDKGDFLQQQIQEKYLLSRPSQAQQQQQQQLQPPQFGNNKFNRNTPQRDRILDTSNEILNKSDNCLLSPIKYSPKEQQNLQNTSSAYEPLNKDKLMSVTTAKQIAAPPYFKKAAKMKLRSKENIEQSDLNDISFHEGRSIKTEGCVMDPIPIISSIVKSPYKNQLNSSSQQIPAASTKKLKPVNMKEAFFVKYNKISSQKNISEQNEILKSLSQTNQTNIQDEQSPNKENTSDGSIAQNSESKSQNEQTKKEGDQEKATTQKNIGQNFNFYELDATIQREESVTILPSNDKVNESETTSDENQNSSNQDTTPIEEKKEQKQSRPNEQNVQGQNSRNHLPELKELNNHEKVQIQQATPSKGQPQQNPHVLEINSEKLPTLSNSQTETPNRSRMISTFSPEKTSSNQDLLGERHHQTSSPNRSNSQEQNGKKPLLKVKLNLETLLFIEEKLFLIYEQVQFHDNISYVHTCKDYLELITSCEQERLERLFGDKQMRKLVKKCLILERLTINLIIFLTLDGSRKEHFNYNIVNLMETISQNYIIILNLLCNQIKQQGIPPNEWISKMEEIISTRRPSIPPQNSVLFLQNSFGKGISLISPVVDMYPDLKKIVNDIFKDLEKNSTQTLITNLLEFFAKKINNYELNRQLGMSEELEGPYLPPAKNENVYTLVLDLDETLIHFVDTPVGGHFLMRPYLEMFLKEMSKIYEIVIFTVGMQNYANWVIDSFDKNKHITHRLYRQHAFSKQYNYVKDLSKIGRDLSKSLIIDNVADNFRLQPSNGILIKSWFSDQSDFALKELIPVLKELIKSKPSDIRPVFKQLRSKYTPQRIKHYFTLPSQ